MPVIIQQQAEPAICSRLPYSAGAIHIVSGKVMQHGNPEYGSRLSGVGCAVTVVPLRIANILNSPQCRARSQQPVPFIAVVACQIENHRNGFVLQTVHKARAAGIQIIPTRIHNQDSRRGIMIISRCTDNHSTGLRAVLAGGRKTNTSTKFGSPPLDLARKAGCRLHQ